MNNAAGRGEVADEDTGQESMSGEKDDGAANDVEK
jgi:hypothetical protein